jgi:hypothetical protein
MSSNETNDRTSDIADGGDALRHISTEQVLSRSENARLLVFTAFGLAFGIAFLLYLLFTELSWINASSQKIGECAGPGFWVRVYDLKAAILLRVIAVCAGATIMFGGMATSHIIVSRSTQLSAEANGVGKGVLATASPGLVGIVLGGAVICFALWQQAKLPAYQPPTVDWCTQTKKGVILQEQVTEPASPVPTQLPDLPK